MSLSDIPDNPDNPDILDIRNLLAIADSYHDFGSDARGTERCRGLKNENKGDTNQLILANNAELNKYFQDEDSNIKKITHPSNPRVSKVKDYTFQIINGLSSNNVVKNADYEYNVMTCLENRYPQLKKTYKDVTNPNINEPSTLNTAWHYSYEKGTDVDIKLKDYLQRFYNSSGIGNVGFIVDTTKGQIQEAVDEFSSPEMFDDFNNDFNNKLVNINTVASYVDESPGLKAKSIRMCIYNTEVDTKYIYDFDTNKLELPDGQGIKRELSQTSVQQLPPIKRQKTGMDDNTSDKNADGTVVVTINKNINKNTKIDYPVDAIQVGQTFKTGIKYNLRKLESINYDTEDYKTIQDMNTYSLLKNTIEIAPSITEKTSNFVVSDLCEYLHSVDDTDNHLEKIMEVFKNFNPKQISNEELGFTDGDEKYDGNIIFDLKRSLDYGYVTMAKFLNNLSVDPDTKFKYIVYMYNFKGKDLETGGIDKNIVFDEWYRSKMKFLSPHKFTKFVVVTIDKLCYFKCIVEKVPVILQVVEQTGKGKTKKMEKRVFMSNEVDINTEYNLKVDQDSKSNFISNLEDLNTINKCYESIDSLMIYLKYKFDTIDKYKVLDDRYHNLEPSTDTNNLTSDTDIALHFLSHLFKSILYTHNLNYQKLYLLMSDKKSKLEASILDYKGLFKEYVKNENNYEIDSKLASHEVVTFYKSIYELDIVDIYVTDELKKQYNTNKDIVNTNATEIKQKIAKALSKKFELKSKSYPENISIDKWEDLVEIASKKNIPICEPDINTNRKEDTRIPSFIADLRLRWKTDMTFSVGSNRGSNKSISCSLKDMSAHTDPLLRNLNSILRITYEYTAVSDIISDFNFHEYCLKNKHDIMSDKISTVANTSNNMKMIFSALARSRFDAFQLPLVRLYERVMISVYKNVSKLEELTSDTLTREEWEVNKHMMTGGVDDEEEEEEDEDEEQYEEVEQYEDEDENNQQLIEEAEDNQQLIEDEDNDETQQQRKHKEEDNKKEIENIEKHAELIELKKLNLYKDTSYKESLISAIYHIGYCKHDNVNVCDEKKKLITDLIKILNDSYIAYVEGFKNYNEKDVAYLFGADMLVEVFIYNLTKITRLMYEYFVDNCLYLRLKVKYPNSNFDNVQIKDEFGKQFNLYLINLSNFVQNLDKDFKTALKNLYEYDFGVSPEHNSDAFAAADAAADAVAAAVVTADDAYAVATDAHAANAAAIADAADAHDTDADAAAAHAVADAAHTAAADADANALAASGVYDAAVSAASAAVLQEDDQNLDDFGKEVNFLNYGYIEEKIIMLYSENSTSQDILDRLNYYPTHDVNNVLDAVKSISQLPHLPEVIIGLTNNLGSQAPGLIEPTQENPVLPIGGGSSITKNKAKKVGHTEFMEIQQSEKLVGGSSSSNIIIQTLNGNSEKILNIVLIMMLFVVLNSIVAHITHEKKMLPSQMALSVLLSNTLLMIILISYLHDTTLNLITYVMYFACVGMILGKNTK